MTLVRRCRVQVLQNLLEARLDLMGRLSDYKDGLSLCMILVYHLCTLSMLFLAPCHRLACRILVLMVSIMMLDRGLHSLTLTGLLRLQRILAGSSDC